MEDDLDLLFVEFDIVLTGDLLAGHRVDVEEVLDDLAPEEVFFDNALNIGNLDRAIKGVFREDLDERALATEAEAPDVVQSDFVLQVVGGDLALQLGFDVGAMGGKAPGAAANDDGALAVKALDFRVKGGRAAADLLLEGRGILDGFH